MTKYSVASYDTGRITPPLDDRTKEARARPRARSSKGCEGTRDSFCFFHVIVTLSTLYGGGMPTNAGGAKLRFYRLALRREKG